MCLLVASTEHPDYALVVLDNRDEYMSRPTAEAHWWPGHDIYAPQDLARKEKGTWIGVSSTGRVAVLLNFHEAKNVVSVVSRGVLPKMYLESGLSPKEWKAAFVAGECGDFSQCGGFTLMVGAVAPDSGQTEVAFVSNRESRFDSLGSHDSISVSNGAVDDLSWLKTQKSLQLLSPLLRERDHARFVQGSIALLSTETPPPPSEIVHLRRHIFVPRVELENDAYGTRTQTVLTIDRHGQLEYTSVDVMTQQVRTEKISIHKSGS